MNKLAFIFVIFFTLIGLVNCSKNIIQYTPIENNDFVLMIGKYGGKDFYLKKALFLNEDSISIRKVGTNKNLLILNYTYSVWASDATFSIDNNKIPEVFKNRINYIDNIMFYDIRYKDENGTNRSLDSIYNYKAHWCLFLKKSKYLKKSK
ncbi:MAG: hypothetical protein WCQ95_11220 [Bacteroidota bacterium]